MKSWRRQAAIWQEGRLSKKIKKSKVSGKSSLGSSRIQIKTEEKKKEANQTETQTRSGVTVLG